MSQAFKSEAATKSYTYAGGSWGDRLTSYDGESITYDDAGYPTTYRGSSLTWSYGNLTRFGSTTFSYNDEGIRQTKGATEYFVKGNQILAEKRGSTVIHYYYDDSGVAGFEYNGQQYYYRKNLQGDIVAICDHCGNLLGEYEYDAWGKILSQGGSELLTINPFRYRGYYYDEETGLYYLNSRYYDPETGRFISPDSLKYLEPAFNNGLNMYIYSYNKPVAYKHTTKDRRNSKNDRIGIRNTSVRINWENNWVQIPVWMSSLMAGSDFGASIAPAARTLYQYIRYPGISDLNKLYGVKFVPGKLNTICSAIGYGLLVINVGLSALSNFSNNNLTSQQQWIGFGVDVGYTLGTFAIGCGVGALISLIPGIGVFLAPFVSAVITGLIEWSNERWEWLDDVKQWFNDL